MTSGTDSPPALFDRSALNASRQRSLRLVGPSGGFLVEEVADRMQERLQEIERPFATSLDIGGRSALMGGSADTVWPLGVPAEADAVKAPGKDYDLITSTLTLHWVNDIPGVMSQARTLLKPDGFILFSLFGGDTLFELRQSLIKAETEILGGVHPRVAPMMDIRDGGTLLQRAGLALPVADMDTLTVTYPDAFRLMKDLRDMGEVNIRSDRPKSFSRRDVMLRTIELYQKDFAGPDRRIPATFQILYLSGWAPHASQQKPLKPGEGKVSLKDALGKAPPKD